MLLTVTGNSVIATNVDSGELGATTRNDREMWRRHSVDFRTRSFRYFYYLLLLRHCSGCSSSSSGNSSGNSGGNSSGSSGNSSSGSLLLIVRTTQASDI